MAMIVGTLAWLPIGALLGIAGWLLLGISPHAFITFGGTFSGPVGMMMWWLVMLLPSSIYAVIASE